jgi:hypothetical protein
MLLSENHIKRLKKLSGISVLEEADNRETIIKKIGLSASIANMAHELSDKYSIWIANTFKDKYINNARIFQGMDQAIKDEVVKQITAGRVNPSIEKDMASNFRAMDGEYRHILDWLRGRNNPPIRETDQIDFKTLTFEEAKQRSESWHAELARLEAGAIKDEQGDIVINFPDGFYWIRLNKSVCDAEAKAMGHCGRARGMLYSLRRERYPYVTVDLDQGVIGQIKGRANTKPKSTYHKYIIALLLNPSIGVKYLHSTYQPHTDFNLNDLTDEQLVEISNRKPTLFGYATEAIKRLPAETINTMLRHAPLVFKGMNQTGLWSPEQLDFIVSHIPSILEAQLGILRTLNEQQISNVLKGHPESFRDILWESIVSWTQEHTNYILSHKPELFNLQKIENLKPAGKISDAQIDWIINNNPKLLAGQSPFMLLKFTKPQLKKIAEGYPETFAQLLASPFKQEDMSNSAIDSEIISMLIRKITPNSDRDGRSFYEYFSRLPNDMVTFDHLKYILEHYADTFFIRNMDRYFNNTNIIADAPKLIQYILDNNNMLSLLSTNQVSIENWPFTEKQKEFIVKTQLEGDVNILDDEDLSKMKFSKKQIEKLIKELPELFDPTKQDYDKLGITAKGIEYIVSKSPGTIPEKKVDEMLSNDEMKSLFKKNPEWTDAVYLLAKYMGYDGVKKLKESLSGGFKPEYVEILYDDWQDEALGNLFDNPDSIKRIANYELDFYGYDFKYSDIKNNFDDLSVENLAYVQYLLKKAFTSQKEGLYKDKKEEINRAVMAMSADDMADVIDDPDEFKEKHKIEDHDEHILDELQNAFVRATEDAQQSADESEYWELYTKPVEEFFGKPDWKEMEVKKFDKETGKEKMEKRHFLKFKMSYGEFLDLLKDYEEYNSSDDDYSIRLKDGKIYPADIISGAFTQRDENLKFEEPYHGVNGDINKDDLNERFGERLYDELSDELKDAKVVVKKKKKA